jgi:probable HAF family extracellular repeat protein
MDGTDVGVTCVLTSVWITVGYTIDDIGVLPGDRESIAMDLNGLAKRDQVVGTSDTINAVLWEHRAAHTPTLVNLERDYCEAAPFSSALGINNTSWVVGFHSFDEPDHPSPVLYEMTGCTALPTLPEMSGLPPSYGEAWSVNDSGTIVGWSVDDSGNRRACRWTSPLGVWEVANLGTLGGPTSAAIRINQSGTIVGRADIADGVEHAFLWTTSAGMQDINRGPAASVAHGVNGYDEVVGELSFEGQPSSAFRWTPSPDIQVLEGLPGSLGSSATAINDHGVVVGRSDIGDTSHAVYWPAYNQPAVSLTAQLLANPGWDLASAESINNRGQIAGNGTNPAGQLRGFLLTPVKVPILNETCTFHYLPPIPVPIPRPSPIELDGGSLVLAADGQITHARPPRSDPLPAPVSPLGVRGLMQLAFAGRTETNLEQVGAMVHQIVERESRSLFEALAREGEGGPDSPWGRAEHQPE